MNIWESLKSKLGSGRSIKFLSDWWVQECNHLSQHRISNVFWSENLPVFLC